MATSTWTQWCSGEAWCSDALTSWNALQLPWQLVALWLAGAIVGYVLPRPKAGSSTVLFTLWSSTPWRRAALAWHAAIITREVWYHWTCPGTFRRFAAAVVRLACGRGWTFDFPTADEKSPQNQELPLVPAAQPATGSDAVDNWYVTEKDLAFFKYHAEGSGKATGVGPWEVMMQKEIPGITKYIAYRRTLANGKTEYKTVTLCPDATAEEFMDMYFDDDNRPNWDTMIIHHEVLEHGDFSQRQQVVRWVRRFPFSFISDREYIIAKRLFREPAGVDDDNKATSSSLYGVTKAVPHPRAPPTNEVIVDSYYSMWRSSTVPCPWGSGKPACETVLLHHEQMKIPENLARFAVKHGMWGFVRKLLSETPKFVEARRRRCEPYAIDQQAYGAGHEPNPPPSLRGPQASAMLMASPFKAVGERMHRSETSTSALSSLTTQSSADAGEGGVLAYRSSTGGMLTRTKSGKLRGLAAFAIASGLALIMHRSSSSDRLSGGPNSPLSARSSSGLGSTRALLGRERRKAAGGMRRVQTSLTSLSEAGGLRSHSLREE